MLPCTPLVEEPIVYSVAHIALVHQVLLLVSHQIGAVLHPFILMLSCPVRARGVPLAYLNTLRLCTATRSRTSSSNGREPASITAATENTVRYPQVTLSVPNIHLADTK